MPKKIDDIVTGRRSIRDIPVPLRRQEPTPVRSPLPVDPLVPQGVRTETFLNRPQKENISSVRKTKFWVWGGVALIVVFFIFFVFRSGATLTYTPITTSLVFTNDSYSASQSGGENELSYSIIKLSGEKSGEVPASGEEAVSLKAEGRVMIYNEQTSSQQLVKTTRLQTNDGKIYRITEDITIPAKGSLEVSAVADQPGESYNIGLSDFTVPGFKGSAKFEKVYARSKTEISGGFIGTRKKVSEEDLASARTNFEDTLKSDLLTQVETQVPTDFILFANLVDVSYKFLPIEASGDNSAKITLKGDLNAVIFKRTELAEYLAKRKIESKNLVGAMDFKDTSSLNVSLLNNINATSTIKINLLGSAELVAITDEAALATDLVGTRKAEVDTLLARYPSIGDASFKVRPFWKSSFPSDVSKIKIVAR